MPNSCCPYFDSKAKRQLAADSQERKVTLVVRLETGNPDAKQLLALRRLERQETPLADIKSELQSERGFSIVRR